MQKKLRAQGMRNVYGMGFRLNTTGNDSNALFDYFLIGYGGKDIVTKTASCMSTSARQGGGDKDGDLSDRCIQIRLHTAGRSTGTVTV
jgi:hypothetical protein